MSLVEFHTHPHARHAAILTLNRPERRNALSIALIDALCDALDVLEDDDDVRVVVLTGAGSSFCAGGDLHAMQERSGEFAGDSAHLRINYQRHIQRVPRRLLRFDKPIIAAINGPAIGAGLDLACMCDLRVAADTARFGSTFVRLGLIPGDGGAYWLSRAIGHARAAELVLTGDIIDATRAATYGLVSEVVALDDLEASVGRLADRIAANAPIALRLAKAALVKSWDLHAEAALELAATYQGIAQRTEDHAEGVDAMLSKRAPNYRHR